MEDDEKAIQSIMEDLEDEEDIVLDSIVQEKMDAQRDALSDLLESEDANITDFLVLEVKNQTDRVKRALRLQREEFRSKLRKVMTGDESKSVREHLKKTREEPFFVKMMDKLSFTLGVLNLTISQAFLMIKPELFFVWYSIVMPLLLWVRIYRFKKLKWQYFLLDFCYFGQVLCFFATFAGLWIHFYTPSSTLSSSIATSISFFEPHPDGEGVGGSASSLHPSFVSLQPPSMLIPACGDSCQLWLSSLLKAIFVATHGPIAIAIVAWRNSFVFHDLDRITTVYIHILPALLLYTLRWHLMRDTLVPALLRGSGEDMGPFSTFLHDYYKPLDWADIALALFLYLMWQIVYILKTEVIDREKLDSDANLQTSLRWLSVDERNAMNIMARSIMTSVGILKKGEKLDPKTMKTKMIFVASQFVYTFLTYLPSFFFFSSQLLNLAYLIFLFVACVFNGGAYYIEVFSSRYNNKFKKET